MGRVPVARSRNGPYPYGLAAHRRRPQSDGSSGGPPGRVPVRGHRPGVSVPSDGRVVVTGGAGFLGSHLCSALLQRGHHVVCVDNLVTGSIDNVSDLFPEARFSFVHHDVSNYVHVPGPVDAVLHFASPASPRDYLELPIQTLKVGSLGTHNCLGLAMDKQARFILASTSEVYGDPSVHPQTEDYWGNVNPV